MESQDDSTDGPNTMMNNMVPLASGTGPGQSSSAPIPIFDTNARYSSSQLFQRPSLASPASRLEVERSPKTREKPVGCLPFTTRTIECETKSSHYSLPETPKETPSFPPFPSHPKGARCFPTRKSKFSNEISSIPTTRAQQDHEVNIEPNPPQLRGIIDVNEKLPTFKPSSQGFQTTLGAANDTINAGHPQIYPHTATSRTPQDFGSNTELEERQANIRHDDFARNDEVRILRNENEALRRQMEALRVDVHAIADLLKGKASM
ncbi:hypothetical protein GQ44DRAFT_831112 [Phaeosphaeriaceae sp. PMI808]|nr:hypothetical protein GQ44DRAFT_831112 [Phaeosphaeriaceae sp. PMI808]